MALLEQWRSMAYSETANKGDLQRLWAAYFEKEKEIYAQLLKNPDEVVKGTVKELAGKVVIEDIVTIDRLPGRNRRKSGGIQPYRGDGRGYRGKPGIR